MRDENQRAIYSIRPSATLTSGWRRRIGVLFVLLAAATLSPAQDEQASSDVVTFNTVINFDGANGGNPISSLVQGTDGNLYGTTGFVGAFGSASSGGTVFQMTPSGSMTVVYNFCALPNCADGSVPTGLTLGTDGNFYGTTFFSGANFSGAGTVFKITPKGTLTTLYSFCSLTNCADGQNPEEIGENLVFRDRREFVWDNQWRRGEWCWHSVQDHPRWHVDETL